MPSFLPKLTVSITFCAVVCALLPVSSVAKGAHLSNTGAGSQQVAFGVDVAIETISVRVTDSSGKPVEGLTATDFIVKEDGIEHEIAFVESAENTPLDVALLLDLSGSMSGGGWRQRTIDFVQALSAKQDCVLLLRFNRNVSASVWGRPGDANLTAAIEESFIGGATSLYDALVEGVQRLAPFAADVGLGTASGPTTQAGRGGSECPAPPPGASADPATQRRTAIVAVTDGVDTTSGHSVAQVELVTLAAGVPVFQIELVQPGRGSALASRRNPTGGMGNPDRNLNSERMSRGGSFGDRNRKLIEFQKLVGVSGGDTFRSGPESYMQLLERLRGSYLVGYRLLPRDAGTGQNEYTRHEIEVTVPSQRRVALHRPNVYRPTFDQVRAQAELAEGIRQLDMDIAASLAAFERSIRANPSFPDPHAWSAQVLSWEEEAESAIASAIRATELEPANGEYHLLVSDLASLEEQYDLAWEHVIRAAQTGLEPTFEFDALAELAPPPDGIRERLNAPRVAILAAPSTQPDLIVRAALPTAIRNIARALSEHPYAALVPDPRAAQYLLWVLDKDLSSKPPRRFGGQLVLTNAAGETVYQQDIRVDDLDDYAKNSDELGRHIREILKNISTSEG